MKNLMYFIAVLVAFGVFSLSASVANAIIVDWQSVLDLEAGKVSGEQFKAKYGVTPVDKDIASVTMHAVKFFKEKKYAEAKKLFKSADDMFLLDPSKYETNVDNQILFYIVNLYLGKLAERDNKIKNAISYYRAASFFGQDSRAAAAQIRLTGVKNGDHDTKPVKRVSLIQPVVIGEKEKSPAQVHPKSTQPAPDRTRKTLKIRNTDGRIKMGVLPPRINGKRISRNDFDHSIVSQAFSKVSTLPGMKYLEPEVISLSKLNSYCGGDWERIVARYITTNSLSAYSIETVFVDQTLKVKPNHVGISELDQLMECLGVGALFIWSVAWSVNNNDTYHTLIGSTSIYLYKEKHPLFGGNVIFGLDHPDASYVKSLAQYLDAAFNPVHYDTPPGPANSER